MAILYFIHSFSVVFSCRSCSNQKLFSHGCSYRCFHLKSPDFLHFPHFSIFFNKKAVKIIFEIVDASKHPCLSMEDYKCVDAQQARFNAQDCVKNACPLECNKTGYDLKISSLSSSSDNLCIYYPSLKHTLISETPKTTIIDLLTNIGGSLSLFVSISFTLFEIAELTVLTVHALLLRRTRNNNKLNNKLDSS